MGNLSGWNLTARLISKHFSGLGDSVAESIALRNPELATEADRDRLASQLHDAAQKLVLARAAFDKEHADVVALHAMIDSDTAISAQLSAKLAAGTVSESQVTAFLDDLEANKARLPAEESEEAQAKEFLDELQKVVDTMAAQMADFDRRATAARRTLETAQAQQSLQSARQSQQAMLSELQGMGHASSALSALTRKAQAISASAEADKMVNDIGAKPAQDASDLATLRASLTAPPAESVADRLKRLSG